MIGDWIDLYWLPLGAGGRSVRWNGRVYERLLGWRDRRPPANLVHSALEVGSHGDRWVVEMAPVWNEAAAERGAVQEGPVGAHWLGRFRAFQYEVRCWRDGRIPDIAAAVGGAQRVSDDPNAADRLLRAVPTVPAFVWGRDVFDCGDMWNSNSLVSWLLATAGLDTDHIHPPAGARAPGWAAGLELAARQAPRCVPIPA